MAVRERLALAAASLAKNNPQDWRAFMIELAAFTEESRNNCVTSELSHLQVNQGKAQALTALCEELGDCVKTVDRAIQRRNAGT
jgi:hypothetical protein